MADYIYLLDNRLSKAQQNALFGVRETARIKGLTVFLVGGAVRDLTSGSPVRDLDVAVQGNALKLRKDLEKAGAIIAGENETFQELFLQFPGAVRMAVGSTLSVHYPKPGKPVVKPANILEDLRRRDFTANAMALSLNEGSYGLLMDPLNGVADIENRELRLVSNYGFIETPARMIRAARFSARLGWQMEEKTQARYETGKAEGYISALSEFDRGYETEEIVYEEDPLRVMRKLEAEGWMKILASAWGSAKANAAEMEKLRDAQAHLQLQGIHADTSAAHFPLLTAKLAPKDVAALKKSFPRKGFVAEIDALEGDGKKFAAELASKQAATPSATWKLLTSARPEVALWVAYSTKSAPLQVKFKSFYTDWPQARQKIPYVLMQEMRIVPELQGFDELVEKLFFELMDGKLGTIEEMKAFLEPYSPPAPPPPVNLRRARAAKKESKAKSRKKTSVAAESTDGKTGTSAEAVLTADVVAALGKGALEAHMGGKVEVSKPKPATPAKTVAPAKSSPPAKQAASTKTPQKVVSAPAKLAAAKKSAPFVAVKPAAAKKAVPAKASVKKSAPAKAVARKAVPAKSSKKITTKAPAKPSAPNRGKVYTKSAKAPAKNKAKTAPKPPRKPAVKSKAPVKTHSKVVTKPAKSPLKAATKKKR